MLAESQAGLARPGRQRLRAICAALIVLMLALVLSVTAFYTVCSGAQFYDNMGYLMLTQKMFATGHALYDQVYTHYGPAYYAYERLLHTLTRLPGTHIPTPQPCSLASSFCKEKASPPRRKKRVICSRRRR